MSDRHVKMQEEALNGKEPEAHPKIMLMRIYSLPKEKRPRRQQHPTSESEY